MSEELNSRFKEFEEEIFDIYLKRNPTMATHLGVHEYDHQLNDISKEKHLKDIELLEEWNERLKSFNPEELNEENRIARKLGIHLFELIQYREKELKHWSKTPTATNVIGGGIFPLLQRDFAPFEERLESIIGRIRDIPTVIEQEKTRLEEPVKLWIDMALESAEQLPMLLKLVLMIAKGKGIDEEKLQELDRLINEADEHLERYIEYLEEKETEAVEDFAIGPEKFGKLLEKREIGYDSDEILDMGEELLEKAKKEMKSYAEQIDPDMGLNEVIDGVMSETPDSFQEALRWYIDGLQDAKDFVTKKSLATIPEDEDIDVIETPEYMRPIIPYAAYMGPAKFDPVKQGIYLVTPPENDDDLKNYSYWDVRNTTVHEGYPGHHLQLTSAMTNDDVFRLFSHAVETVEGWAHYCEEMMKDHGFDDTPEARLIQTKDVVWRASRIIVDVKLSRGEMGFDEAVEFLVNNAKLKEKDAAAEVKRYTQNPAYQLSYLLGREMIKDLKKDVKEKMGEDFDEKFFHDTILYAGSVPMKYLKEIFDKKIEERVGKGL